MGEERRLSKTIEAEAAGSPRGRRPKRDVGASPIRTAPGMHIITREKRGKRSEVTQQEDTP